jgi:hypothetical protein
VAWSLAQRPKKKGGLGIKNLYLQNDALLMKQLHKFYSKEDTPWVQQVWFKYYANRVPHSHRVVGSFWWKDIFELKDLYTGITTCQLGDGSSILFWKDNWTGDCLIDFFPVLAHFAKHVDISVKQVTETDSLEDLFHIPISQQAALELEELKVIIQDYALSEEIDQRIFCWGNNTFAAAKLYKLAFQPVQIPVTFSWVWKSKVTPRVKFFAWLVLLDRLNTKNMLSRRRFNVQPNTLCVLCGQGLEETIEHLFFDCPFARDCWTKIGITWDNDVIIHKRIERTKHLSGRPFFMETFLIAAWEIWKIRNRLVFDGVQASFNRWVRNFKEEASLQSLRIKEADRAAVLLWLDAL